MPNLSVYSNLSFFKNTFFEDEIYVLLGKLYDQGDLILNTKESQKQLKYEEISWWITNK